MKKKLLAVMLSAVLSVTMLAGCGNSKEETAGDLQPEVNSAVEQQITNNRNEDITDREALQEADEEETQNPEEENQKEVEDDTVIRVGGLKGPTSMGLAKILSDAQNGEAACNIDFTMAAAADELTPSFIQGELDIIAVPSNLASVLYNKTEGAVQVLALNTLGVTYIVDTGDSVASIEDLRGKTIYATGQGAVPEYSLKYLLQANGLDPENDVTIEWKSEATEIVSIMTSSEEEVIAMLPQPFVTVAQTQVEGLNVALDLNEQWEALDNGSALITGVLVVRSAFAEEHPELVAAFLDEYQASTEYANSNVEEAAVLIENLDIVKAAVAQKALPKCNITFVAGEEMKTALSGFLQILFDQNPASVGGALPGEDFYYIR